jgi:hypothetical protein
MRRSVIRLVLGLGLSAAGALLVSTPGESQLTQPSKVKLTGSDLQEQFLSRHAVIAGVNHMNGCVFMTVSQPGGAREQYWNCTTQSGTAPGTGRLAGDRICFQYPLLFAGAERCWEYYRIGEDKYEGWEDGKHVITFSKLK